MGGGSRSSYSVEQYKNQTLTYPTNNLFPSQSLIPYAQYGTCGMDERYNIEVGNATESYCTVSGPSLTGLWEQSGTHTVYEYIEDLGMSPHPYGKPDWDRILTSLGISHKA